MNAPQEHAALLAAIQTCRRFIGPQQIRVMRDNCNGEEGDWFRAKFIELAAQFEAMPKTYAQDGLGDQAIVHMHYFKGSGDWWITEKDVETPEEPGQHQAFGLADLYGDGGELGYISIVELIRCGVEFDLYWTPCTLADLRSKRERRAA